MLKLTDMKDYEERDIVATLIVKDGQDTGISGKAPGYLIHKLELVLAEILEWPDEKERKEKLSETDGN